MPSSPDPSPPAILDPVQVLGERFREAIVVAFPSLVTERKGEQRIDPLIAPSKQPALGDFQSNAAMPLAKRLSMKPHDVAKAIVKHAKIDDIADPLSDASIAGPGFINIRLRGEALASLILHLDTPDLGLPRDPYPQTIVVDLMGVNLAKQMHVGHLRSPIIGDALAKAFERLGHKVIRQNHVGDWGLPIAMVTARLMRESAAGRIDLRTITLDDLDRAYKDAQAECQRDLTGLAAVRRYGLGPKAEAELEEQVAGATEAFTSARQILVRLQSGDAEVHAVWQRIADVTMDVCLAACRRLHVNCTAEHSAGESSYAAELAPMVAELESRGIAEIDQGALVIRLDHPPTNPSGEPLFTPIKEPCLIRKTDGGYLYATTDIAAIRRRVQKFAADRIVYSIDARQNLHLRQVFASSIRAGYATNPKSGRVAIMEHAAFGSVLGDDGRPFKTRSGETVKLADLLQETVDRARAAVVARHADRAGDRPLLESEASTIAEGVGLAALKYADLSTDRVKDYVFSFDRMLAFEGNTGPYLLYALVRVKSIFRRASERGVSIAGHESASLLIREPAEKSLALALLRYPASVRVVAESLEPHRLCAYAYDLAGAFGTFFDACPVLAASDDAMRLSRLRLCAITGRVLEDALATLGIPALERM
jgi:arginyl-tRNA synthetase